MVKNITTLLKAAEYLDHREVRDRENEHGYAAAPPAAAVVHASNFKRKRTGKLLTQSRAYRSIRSTHNELEKNRRAHLHSRLECLKDVVPLPTDVRRHTMLGLLIEARLFVARLEENAKEKTRQRDELETERQVLRQRLSRLTDHRGQSWMREHGSHGAAQWYCHRTVHSISESSNSTNISSTSDEQDEVSIAGYSSDTNDGEVGRRGFMAAFDDSLAV